MQVSTLQTLSFNTLWTKSIMPRSLSWTSPPLWLIRPFSFIPSSPSFKRVPENKNKMGRNKSIMTIILYWEQPGLFRREKQITRPDPVFHAYNKPIRISKDGGYLSIFGDDFQRAGWFLDSVSGLRPGALSSFMFKNARDVYDSANTVNSISDTFIEDR